MDNTKQPIALISLRYLRKLGKVQYGALKKNYKDSKTLLFLVNNDV